MKKLVLAGVNILAVVLLILGSQSNVVGYQTVQSSVKERLNEKDLLFQTICDLSNNKEVQKAILESQTKFQNPFPTSQLTSFPTITKKQLNIMYHLGIVLSQTVGKARIESLFKEHPMSVRIRDNVDAIIVDIKINEETLHLSNSDCNCNDETNPWTFPMICSLLNGLYIGASFIVLLCFFINDRIIESHLQLRVLYLFGIFCDLVSLLFIAVLFPIISIANIFNCELFDPYISHQR
jgi:hypothetical protein